MPRMSVKPMSSKDMDALDIFIIELTNEYSFYKSISVLLKDKNRKTGDWPARGVVINLVSDALRTIKTITRPTTLKPLHRQYIYHNLMEHYQEKINEIDKQRAKLSKEEVRLGVVKGREAGKVKSYAIAYGSCLSGRSAHTLVVDEIENKLTKIKSEKPMKKNFETRNYIKDVNMATMSDDEIFHQLAELEAEVKQLSHINITSSKVTKAIKGLNKDIARIVKVLDAR